MYTQRSTLRFMMFTCLAVVLILSVAPDAAPTAAESDVPNRFLFKWGAQSDVGQFREPWGMAVSPDGTVYVADRLNHRIQRFTATGEFLTTWGAYGSGEGQFAFPQDVVVAGDRSVYVSDSDNGRVQRFTEEGEFLTAWSVIGLSGPPGGKPVGVDVGADGTVYVLDASARCIYLFTATGAYLGRWAGGGSGNNVLVIPTAIAVASDGNVYVGDTYPGCIRRFSATGEYLGTWAPGGPSSFPHGVATAPDGSIYVADNNAQVGPRIWHLDAAGALLGQWGSKGTDDGQFDTPRSVAVASTGTVYVADTGNSRIQRFSATGTFVGKWGGFSFTGGQFNKPSGIAVAPSGDVYTVDTNNYRIQQFTADGAFPSTWGSEGTGDGQLGAPHFEGPEGPFSDYGPQGIAIAPDGSIYVADTENHRVQQFTSSGAFVCEWGTRGSRDGQFYRPSGVAVGPDGTVYVLDSYHSRVQSFTSTGTFLSTWGSNGSGDGQFGANPPVAPYGIAVAPDGKVYVTDTYNSRVEYFSATGDFLGKWGGHGDEDGQFMRPYGIAIGSDGTVYVADTGNGRLQAFTADGQFLGEWGSRGAGDGQFAVYFESAYSVSGLRGVAVGSDGNVYVADTAANRIQVFGTASPDTWRGEYHPNPYLAGSPVPRQDATINFDWGTGSPIPGMVPDTFSVRWYRFAPFSEGTYQFTASANDGVRLWVDGTLLVDEWRPGGGTYRQMTVLTAGYHEIVFEYFDGTDAASAALSWTGQFAPTPTRVPGVQPRRWFPILFVGK